LEDANRQVDDEGQQPVLGRHPGRESRSPQTHAQQPAENRSFFIQPAKDITFHGIYFQKMSSSFHLFQEGVRSVLSKSTPDLGEGRAELL
jgi:hypothetical protein